PASAPSRHQTPPATQRASALTCADSPPSATLPHVPTKEKEKGATPQAEAHSYPAYEATVQAAYAAIQHKLRVADRSPGSSPAQTVAESTRKQAAATAPEKPAAYHLPSTTQRPYL